MADGTSSETRTSGIFKAMLAVQKEVGAIGKDRTNSSQHYKFRGIDDVLAVLQPLFNKHGIICTPEVLTEEREILPTKNDGRMMSVRLKVKHTYEASDGSTKVATTYGEAMDSGDKAGNKAMSAALKYAHTESFSIPTYEADRDTEEQSPELAAKTDARPQSGTKPQTVPASKPGTSRPAPKPAGNGAGFVFPNYGRAKGQPVAGADVQNLNFYREGCIKSLNDPSKSRWHEKEQALLNAIDAEIASRMGPGPAGEGDEPPPPGDEDAPF